MTSPNAFAVKFIKNPPTTEDLAALYESAMYRDLLAAFEQKSGHRLDARDMDRSGLTIPLSHLKRHYLILNIPFAEVLSEFARLKETVLRFTLLSVDFFAAQEDEADGEFPAGEEPDEDDKSATVENLGIARTFMLEKFCEAYLLDTGDKARLLHFLQTTRMPNAKKYAGQIAKLYKQAVSP